MSFFIIYLLCCFSGNKNGLREIRGVFNKFPDNFCTGRLLKIQYVIAIHFMRWLTNFYDLRFKWTATAEIGIHPTKAWLSQLVNFKNAIWTCFKLGKMPQKCRECFQLLLEYLAWIEPHFLSGIRDSRKAGSLWGMMRSVGGVRKPIHLSWLAKGLGLGLYNFEVLREFRKRFRRERPALFKSSQWHFQQDNAPVHISILVTGYLTKMGIKTVLQPPCSSDLTPCAFCLYPKLRGCRYETIEEIKEAVAKVIDTLTQKLLERFN